MHFYHGFHILKPAFWPLVISLELLIFMIETLNSLSSPFNERFFLFVSLGLIGLTILFWLNDITIEGVYNRHHTEKVTQSKRMGAISEIMLLVGFFWAFFHSFLAPSHTLNVDEVCLDMGKIITYVVMGAVLGAVGIITGLNVGAVIVTAQTAASVSKIDVSTVAVAHHVVATINQSGSNVPVAVEKFLVDSASTASPTVFFCLVTGLALFGGIIFLCSTIIELESNINELLRNPDTCPEEITKMGFDLDLLTQYPILVIFLIFVYLINKRLKRIIALHNWQKYRCRSTRQNLNQ